MLKTTNIVEIKDLNKWKDVSYSWKEDVTLLGCQYHLRRSRDSTQSLSKFPQPFLKK